MLPGDEAHSEGSPLPEGPWQFGSMCSYVQILVLCQGASCLSPGKHEVVLGLLAQLELQAPQLPLSFVSECKDLY